MARLALKAAIAAALLTTAAHAQQARVVLVCGNLAPFGANVAGQSAFPTQDMTGKLCTSGGGAVAGAITPDGSGLVVQKSSTQAQAFRVYNTYTDASNGEWGALDWQTTPNVLTIGTAANGTGTARPVKIMSFGTVALDLDATASNWLVINRSISSNLQAQFSSVLASNFASSGTQPTITGAGGTCATTTKVGGATAGTVVLSAVCALTNTIAFTGMPAAPNGYSCDAEDRTTRTAGPFIESASTTTGFTLTVVTTSSVAGDILQFKCMGY